MQAAGASPIADALPHLTTGALALQGRSHGDVAELLQACCRSTAAVADEWVAASTAAKGWTNVAHAAAEEWASGPLPVARFLRVLHCLHRELAAGRLPALRRSRTRLGGRDSYDVVPARGLCDPVLLRHYRARVDCAAGSAPKAPERRGEVALVLGAGNVTATPMLDVLDQVFLHGRAVVLKSSPLHRALASVFDCALAPLRAAGLVQICGGDALLGQAIARRPDIATVHVTGAVATWAALRADQALAGKHLSAEVGCCTPAFVVPGAWRDGELRFVAQQLAAYVAMNGGATCLAPRVVLTANGWPQRRVFLQHLREELAALPPRVPFHGSARAHFATAAGADPTSEALAPTLRQGLDWQHDRDLCAAEHFAPIVLELPLPGEDAIAWLEHAVAFVRDHVFGALSAYVWVPPRMLLPLHQTLHAALDALPHGTIAINCWTGLGYGLGNTPWGVPPGSPWQCGVGWTRDTTCLPGVQRVVVEAPLRPRPLPPWLPAHRGAASTLRALTNYYLAPSPLRMLATAAHALRVP